MSRGWAWVLGLVAVAACGRHADQEAELGRAIARWRAAGAHDYDVVQQVSCFCGFPTPDSVLVLVRQDTIASATDASTGQPIASMFAGFYYDVEELFDLVQSAIDRDASRLDVQYQAVLGYPTAIDIDFAPGIADDEIRVQVFRLTVPGR